MDIYKLQYHYTRWHRHYRVWQCVERDERHSGYLKYADVDTQEEAKELVYQLNGWTKKTA